MDVNDNNNSFCYSKLHHATILSSTMRYYHEDCSYSSWHLLTQDELVIYTLQLLVAILVAQWCYSWMQNHTLECSALHVVSYDDDNNNNKNLAMKHRNNIMYEWRTDWNITWLWSFISWTNDMHAMIYYLVQLMNNINNLCYLVCETQTRLHCQEIMSSLQQQNVHHSLWQMIM